MEITGYKTEMTDSITYYTLFCKSEKGSDVEIGTVMHNAIRFAVGLHKLRKE